MRSIVTLLCLPLFAFSTACSDHRKEASPSKVKIHINLGSGPQTETAGLLTEVAPAFAGVGVGDGESRASIALNLSGDTTLDVPRGESVPFRATLVAWSTTDGKRVMYVSQATQNERIVDSTTEVTLVFGNYTPVEQVNVYGLVHESNSAPATSAEIYARDPFSGAWLVKPSGSALATSNEHGAFGFSVPLVSLLNAGNLTLRIKHASGTRDVALPANNNGKPGVTLPYINLSGASESVSPTFTNLTDFDADGTPNSAELLLGTDPFSELSGQAGAQGPQGAQGAQGTQGAQGPAGQNGTGVRLQNAAGNIFEILGGSSYFLAKLSDGMYFPTNAAGTYNWHSYSNSYPLRICTNAAGETASGGGCGSLGGNSSHPYYYDACYFYGSDCSGTCYLPFKPIANRLFPVCTASSASGGGCSTFDLRKALGTESLTAVASGASSPGYYKFFYDGSSCQPTNTSSAGNALNFWPLPSSQRYALPTGLSYPIGPLYLVE
jgi:hypothetical protein